MEEGNPLKNDHGREGSVVFTRRNPEHHSVPEYPLEPDKASGLHRVLGRQHSCCRQGTSRLCVGRDDSGHSQALFLVISDPDQVSRSQ